MNFYDIKFPNQLLKPNESLDRIMLLPFLLLLMLNFGQSPIGGAASITFIALTLFSLVAILATRNLYVAALVLLSLNVAFRLKSQISHWPDQIFVQNFGLSSVLSGTNIYSAGNLAEHSFSYYLPMGSLFGSAPIFFGYQNYWDFYHLLVPLLLLIPFVHRPSVVNLAIFIVTAFFFPLVDYTTGGGNVELNYAFLIPGIYLLMNERRATGAIVLLSFGIMLRQPNVFLIPFVLLVFLKRSQGRHALGFVALLFLSGGIYIAQDTTEFLRTTLSDSAAFQDVWIKRNGGLTTNFSISTVLQYLGYKEPWTYDARLYLYGTLASNLAITVGAGLAYWRGSISEKGFLALGMLTVLLVYTLSRGYVFLHYVMSCCYLFLSLFCLPSRTRYRRTVQNSAEVSGRGFDATALYTNVITTVVLFLIGFPLALLATHRFGTTSKVELAATVYMDSPGASTRTKLDMSKDRNGVVIPVGASVVVGLDQRETVESIKILGQRFAPAIIEGVKIFNYPNGNQTTGFISKGTILGSVDGVAYFKIRDFENVVNYHVFPLLLPVDASVRYLKIEVHGAYDRSKVAVIGNILVNRQ